uniref:Mitochondrial fission 1 protein n=1 Tax=Panthera leo TaxID=9689 RepID=A0A8C8XCJ3_PANLE
MEAVLNELVSVDDLLKFEKKFQSEKAGGSVSKSTQFEYAWCLVRSKYNDDIRKGIALLEELLPNGSKEEQRDYVFYLAVGNYRLKEYEKALKYVRGLLQTEPQNNQAKELEQLIDKAMKKGYLQACRALMITAIFLGFLGLFLGMAGLRCVNIGSMELSRKARLAAVAGALHILAGFCGMVAISWYAFNITQEFFDPLYPGTKYELGPALYLGWSASLLAILGGVCLGSTCCRTPDAAPAPAPRLPYQASAVRSPGLAAPLHPAVSDEEGDSSFGKYGKNAYV